MVGAAPTGDAPTTSELSTILLPTKVRLILEVLRLMPHDLPEGLLHVFLVCNSMSSQAHS